MSHASDPDLQARARNLHDKVISIDACAPILNDLEHARHWRTGGVTCGFATMALAGDDLRSAVLRIARWYRQAQAFADTVVPARSIQDIECAKAEAKLAVVLAFQNSSPLDYELGMIEVFHQLGIRSIILAYNQAELAGDGCLETRNGGLSRFGRQAIQEMNRVGILVDLSHCGVRTSMEAIDASDQPVAFTHTGAKAVHDHPRNISDEQILAVASRGGLIGINSHPAFIKGTAAPSLSQVVDHLDHIVSLVGVQHVGMGLDFSQPPGSGGMPLARYHKLLADGVWTKDTLVSPPWTYPIDGPAHIPAFTAELLGRGYAEADVAAILGGNFLRLLERVWSPEAGAEQSE